MKIFIGLTEVSGYYSNLKKGFDDIGAHAEYVSLHAHPFGYGETTGQSPLAAFARYCVAKRVALTNRRSFQGAFWWLLVLLTRIPLFVWALVRFDAFILGGGSAFFRYAEIPLLKLFGKKVIYMFHGTDSRPAYVDGFCENIPRGTAPVFEAVHARINNDTFSTVEIARRVRTYIRATGRRKSNVLRVERFADVCVNHPAHGHFHTRPFVVSLIMGLPYVPDAMALPPSRKADGSSVRVLHSPSQPEGKGTHQIRRIVSELQAEGYAIDFVEIMGRPNVEVLQELQCCDFVIDQLYSDFPMAAFAMEAAFFGKPAVVGGYYAEHIKNDIWEEWIPPSLFCHPDKLKESIARLVTDSEFRLSLGEKAQKFVSSRWHACEVASRYMRLINGDIPKEWFFDPDRIEYMLGCGQPEARTKAIVRAIIERCGKAGLQLGYKPRLEQMFVDLANK